MIKLYNVSPETERTVYVSSCRIFIDLDYTLYRTDALIAHIVTDLELLGFDREAIKQAQTAASKEGYSFDRHLSHLGVQKPLLRSRRNAYQQLLEEGDFFLLPAVQEGLDRLQRQAKLHLLTYGRPSYQRRKVRGIQSLKGLFTTEHYIWQEKTKGDVIRKYGDECQTFFLDDLSTHLEDACKKAPWTTCIRMQWPVFSHNPHPLDEVTWRVIHSFETFVTLVEERL